MIIPGKSYLGNPVILCTSYPSLSIIVGIFEMWDPDWSNANLVYVPYCSSDAHMGDNEHYVSTKTTFPDLPVNNIQDYASIAC